MPNDNSGDIQIKPAGGTANSQSSAAGGSRRAALAAAASQQSTQQAQPVTTAASSATPSNSQPANTRAFNLESDVDNAASGPAKPEKYAIPKAVKEKYPELIDLIKATESMDDQEREYWFQIMPIMTTDQIEKFRNILLTEKQQLQELDKEYEEELNRLNEKHLLEWKEFESKEKSKAIKDAESANAVSEKQLEEDLLSKLSDV
jgi:hypothetical protein